MRKCTSLYIALIFKMHSSFYFAFPGGLVFHLFLKQKSRCCEGNGAA